MKHLHTWEVHTLIPMPKAEDTKTPCVMSVAAEGIGQVLDYIAADLNDEATELVAIIRRDPIVAVLRDKSTPNPEPEEKE